MKHTKANSHKPNNLSYFHLKLLSYLQVNHPDKLNNHHFIAERTKLAEQSYSHAIYEGLSHEQATDVANLTLHKDLIFSPFNMLLEILQVEFSYQAPKEVLPLEVVELLGVCQDVFEKHSLGDNYAYDQGYQELYTELIGTIQIMLEEADHEL